MCSVGAREGRREEGGGGRGREGGRAQAKVCGGVHKTCQGTGSALLGRGAGRRDVGGGATGRRGRRAMFSAMSDIDLASLFTFDSWIRGHVSSDFSVRVSIGRGRGRDGLRGGVALLMSVGVRAHVNLRMSEG